VIVYRPLVVDWLQNWLRSAMGVKVTRYSIGSVVALATSEVTFAVLYATGWLGTSSATAVAFCAGAIPNWILNRRWAWERRGRLRVSREVVLYAVVSFVSWAASAVATGEASSHLHGSHTARVVLVSGAYAATYGVLFLVKFVVFERAVFVDA
jgi:putative flippase GtrA